MAPPITWKKLLNASADDLCIIGCDESLLDDLTCTPPKETAVRAVRGARCTSKERTLQEWAAALQFPSSFGTNWDAFEDCMNDLEWLNARRVVAVVTRADEMLPRSARAFAMLTDILRTAQKETPLLVLYHCTPGNEAALRRRIEQSR